MSEDKGASVADILEKAAKLIERRGWTQGAYDRSSQHGVSYCALGACFAARSNADVGAINDRLAQAVAAALGFQDPGEVARWNDAPERTQPEVVVKLREAAATARKVSA